MVVATVVICDQMDVAKVPRSVMSEETVGTTGSIIGKKYTPYLLRISNM